MDGSHLSDALPGTQCSHLQDTLLGMEIKPFTTETYALYGIQNNAVEDSI